MPKCQHCHGRQWTNGLKVYTLEGPYIRCEARKLTRSLCSTGTLRENSIHQGHRERHHQKALWWLSSVDSRRDLYRIGLTDSKKGGGTLEQEWLTLRIQGSAMTIISEKLRVAAEEAWTTETYGNGY